MSRVLTRKDILPLAKLLFRFTHDLGCRSTISRRRNDIFNTAAGGVGYQLETSGGKVRASGTFTFVSGIVFYYCFSMAFIIYGFINKNTFPKWLLYLGTGATFLAMVTAGSRAVIAESLQVVACFSFLAFYRPTEFGKISASVLGISTIGIILYYRLDLFKEGLSFQSPFRGGG